MSDKLELTVQIEVSGTTFQAVYGVKGKVLELTSPDFGEGSAPLDGADPEIVAERVLRGVVEQGMRTAVGVIMRDDETNEPAMLHRTIA